MVRLDRLTITTSSGRTPTVPVGALPRKVSVSASAASSSVVASTQRLRKPSWISLPAMIRMLLIGLPPAPQEVGVELVQDGWHDIEIVDAA